MIYYNDDVVKFRVSCKQRWVNDAHTICPAVYYYCYSKKDRKFTLASYKNEHVHFPSELSKEIIAEIFEDKKKLR